MQPGFECSESHIALKIAKSLEVWPVCSRSDFSSNDSILAMFHKESLDLFIVFLCVIVQRETEPAHNTIRHVLTCNKTRARRRAPPPKAGGVAGERAARRQGTWRPAFPRPQGEIFLERVVAARLVTTK